MDRKYFVALGLFLLMAVESQGAPITGTFSQVDGDMLGGRWSESYNGGGPTQFGNEITAGSWDGASLGSQWELSGATVFSDNLVDETIISSQMKTLTYYTVYANGTIKLKDGDWTTLGDGEYTVDVSNFTQTTVVTLFKPLPASPWTPIVITGIISMQGTFPAYSGYEMNYFAATSSIVGQGSTPPAGYPSISAASGQWGYVNDTTMEIIPEPATLGLLAFGALAVLRRRRTA